MGGSAYERMTVRLRVLLLLECCGEWVVDWGLPLQGELGDGREVA